jgi:hypothetical protein
MEPIPEEASTTDEGMVRLFIDAGRSSGVRPADIVGAIANEAGVPGNAIGAIDIYDKVSFVDIPESLLPRVIERMNGATIRSRDVRIRVATPRDEAPGQERRQGKPRKKRIFQKSKRRARPEAQGRRRPGKRG